MYIKFWLPDKGATGSGFTLLLEITKKLDKLCDTIVFKQLNIRYSVNPDSFYFL